MKLLTGGEMIAIRRRRISLTQAELAEMAGCCRDTVHRTENGGTATPGAADKMAQAMGMPAGALWISAGLADRDAHEDLGAMQTVEQALFALFQMKALNGMLDVHQAAGWDVEGNLVEAGGCPGKDLCEVCGNPTQAAITKGRAASGLNAAIQDLEEQYGVKIKGEFKVESE